MRYLVDCDIGENTYKGIANYGARPTFGDDNNEIFEIYLLGYSGECYGEHVKVRMIRFLRDIIKFESDFELKAQIEEDLVALKQEEETAKAATVE